MAASIQAAYDFDLFDTGKSRMSTAAPKIKTPAKPRLVKETPRSQRELIKEARTARAYALKILAVCAVMLVLVGSLIFGRVQIMEISAQADELQIQYKEAQSENVRLQSEVKSMYSITNISAYAEEKLGMIKKDCCQVNYFSVGSDTAAQ